jgi:hypothetical protein
MNMLKRVVLSIVAALFVATVPASAQEAWDRTHESCDLAGPRGPLCVNLSYFRLDEPVDTLRVGETGGVLIECPGTDIATTTTVKLKTERTATFDGSANKGFIVYGGGGFGVTETTLMVWVYPTANATSTIFSTQDSKSPNEGVKFELNWNGTNLSPAISAYYADNTGTAVAALTRTAVTINAWHLVVYRVGVSTSRKTWGTLTYGYSVDGAAWVTGTLTAPLKGNTGGNLVFGKSDAGADNLTGACSNTGNGFTGHMQGIAFYPRVAPLTDVTSFYNAGNGRDFPFLN